MAGACNGRGIQRIKEVKAGEPVDYYPNNSYAGIVVVHPNGGSKGQATSFACILLVSCLSRS